MTEAGGHNGRVTHPTSSRRGSLRVLLGAAPGVGKTYAMLNEGKRRARRGTDVVVAFVETHGRPETAAQLEGLEVVPRRTLEHRGATFTEMDLDAVLARHPQVALVDELAHTNVPGSRHQRRADDVEELLAAGIDVITTVNVQHLESLNDVVEQITGIKQRETVPDATVRAADQIELVDMAPEALRRRMAHGNVYAPAKVDEALRNYFRPGNLAALRELALLWVADRVEAGLAAYRADESIAATWRTRDRVVVALSGGPEGSVLIRRGAGIAHKGVGGELYAAYVARSDGLVHVDRSEIVTQRRLVQDLSGTFTTLTGDDPASVVLDYARTINATHIVVGTTRAPRWQRLFREPIDRQIVNGSGDIDVHLVSHQWAASGIHRRREPLARRRRALGLGLALVLPWVLVVALSAAGTNEAFALMAFLALTVAVALVGGLVPALVAAVGGSLLANWYFTEPLHTLTISDPRSLTATVVSLLVGAACAAVVDRAASRARAAAQARAEADTLFLLTEETLTPGMDVNRAVEIVRETFRQDAVELRTRATVTSPWHQVAAAGTVPDDTPDTVIPLSEHTQLACHGRGLTPPEERVLTAFGHQFQARLERDELREQARQVDALAARDQLQTALLAAVSHDLRTPLATIKAGATSLQADDVEFSPEQRDELVGLIDHNADRLERLIGNLLDLTRLRTGHLPVVRRESEIVDLVQLGVHSADADRVETDVPTGLPTIVTDPGLVERVLGNLVDNAVRHEPVGRKVLVTARQGEDGIEINVVDHGPGVPPEQRAAMFEPFQRIGDTPQGTGLGLGLAVAGGFAQSLGARLTPAATPGGGLTMTLLLPISEESCDD